MNYNKFIIINFLLGHSPKRLRITGLKKRTVIFSPLLDKNGCFPQLKP